MDRSLLFGGRCRRVVQPRSLWTVCYGRRESYPDHLLVSTSRMIGLERPQVCCTNSGTGEDPGNIGVNDRCPQKSQGCITGSLPGAHFKERPDLFTRWVAEPVLSPR